jgi:hypothetical protein
MNTAHFDHLSPPSGGSLNSSEQNMLPTSFKDNLAIRALCVYELRTIDGMAGRQIRAHRTPE